MMANPPLIVSYNVMYVLQYAVISLGPDLWYVQGLRSIMYNFILHQHFFKIFQLSN